MSITDAAQARVSPCGGCVACGYDGPRASEMEWNADRRNLDALKPHFRTLARSDSARDE